jgi:hypothetical protein
MRGTFCFWTFMDAPGWLGVFYRAKFLAVYLEQTIEIARMIDDSRGNVQTCVTACVDCSLP